ncbi:MAG: STAS domain-containing protein [Ruminococcaceae bacterium]|nr:STAS domain-containing protein [Oscillospiraceae bacterium]
MKSLKPMLFTTLKGYTRQQFIKDVVSGLIVAIIALPLSIALALASGVGPEKGIYTAIVAGFVISFLGGSTVQISGPTAAFATIVAGIVAKNGFEGLVIATILAGIILILMGVFRFGTLIKFIPSPIATGFTAGIAVTIVIGQLKDFFGLTYPAGLSPVETMEKLHAVFSNFSSINLWAVVVGLISLAILIVWPMVCKKIPIPASLIAVLAGIVLARFLPVNTIGDLYTITSDLPKPNLPAFSFETIRTVLPDAFTIAVLAAIESLLSCVVADGMTGTRHRSNMELVAQGAGNIASALFGGIPATGAIARTAANINNGGRTPIAGMVHALVLLLILVVLMPYAALIPMSTIAAILFMVAYNMCQWRPFVRQVRTAPKSDVAVLLVTFFLTVIFDLVIAIEFGMLLAAILLIKRMSERADVHSWRYTEEENDPDHIALREVPLHVRVYEISGPMFFGAADRLSAIRTKDFTKVLILRMRGVPSLDFTAMSALEELFERCRKKGVTLILSHVNEQPMNVMQRAGFVEKVGQENFCEHIDEALARANELK